MLTDAYGGVGRWVKNSEMLMDAYARVGGWVKKLGNAYGCLPLYKWVGRPEIPKYLLMR